jgi:cation diffusion facilitator family transporter
MVKLMHYPLPGWYDEGSACLSFPKGKIIPMELPRNHPDHIKAAQRVFWITLGLNAVVSVAKLGWGFHSNTLSLTADGFHSLLDAVANVVGIVGLSFSGKPADHNHPYGHRKFEAVASMVISFFIFLTCFEIVSQGFARFFSPEHTHPHITATSYWIIGITLLINVWITLYERRKAKLLGNDLLLADAQHTLSDCLVSGSVVVSMVLVQLGYLWADTVIALVVGVIILKVGFDLIMTHFSALTDEAVLDPIEVQTLVLSVPGVLDCHKIRSRGMQNHVFIDLHIQVDSALTVKEAHRISYAVEERLEGAFNGRVSDVLVHVEEFVGLDAPHPAHHH